MDQLYINEQEREIALNTRLKFRSEKLYKITQDLFDYQRSRKNSRRRDQWFSSNS